MSEENNVHFPLPAYGPPRREQNAFIRDPKHIFRGVLLLKRSNDSIFLDFYYFNQSMVFPLSRRNQHLVDRVVSDTDNPFVIYIKHLNNLHIKRIPNFYLIIFKTRRNDCFITTNE